MLFFILFREVLEDCCIIPFIQEQFLQILQDFLFLGWSLPFRKFLVYFLNNIFDIWPKVSSLTLCYFLNKYFQDSSNIFSKHSSIHPFWRIFLEIYSLSTILSRYFSYNFVQLRSRTDPESSSRFIGNFSNRLHKLFFFFW